MSDGSSTAFLLDTVARSTTGAERMAYVVCERFPDFIEQVRLRRISGTLEVAEKTERTIRRDRREAFVSAHCSFSCRAG